LEFRTSATGVGNLMKSNQVDAIVALDDYDVEKAHLRENLELMVWDKLRTRDKLAMRMRAKSCGISIPSFVLYLTIMTSILSLITFLLHGF
jgi:hypothetical protein